MLPIDRPDWTAEYAYERWRPAVYAIALTA